jgi:hypothetical protein
MSIRDWPKNERPREKLIERGAAHDLCVGLSFWQCFSDRCARPLRGEAPAISSCNWLIARTLQLRAHRLPAPSRTGTEALLPHSGRSGIRPAPFLRRAMCIGSVLRAAEATRLSHDPAAQPPRRSVLLPLPLAPANQADSYGHTAAAPETVGQLCVKFSLEPICYSATTPAKRRPEDPEVEARTACPLKSGSRGSRRNHRSVYSPLARAYWTRNCSCRCSHTL